jgi:NitT/TauT family transport system substrate-binding protein
VAKEEGLFANNGLDVQLSQFPNSADGYTALLAGKLDVIAMGSTAPAVYISKGSNLTEFGGLMGEGTASVTLPRNADKYKNISGWKGTTIATVRMSTGDVVYRSAMLDAGLNLSTDVTIQELKTPQDVMDAVKSGKADIGIVWLPYQQVAGTQGLAVINYGDEFYAGHPCCRFTVTNTTLENDRSTYVRFEKALIEAYHFVKTNPNQTVADVKKYAQFNDSVIYDSIYSGHFMYSPDPNKKAIEEWWADMNKVGYINSTVNIDDHIDTSVYKQALDEVIKESPNDSIYQELVAEYQKNDA